MNKRQLSLIVLSLIVLLPTLANADARLVSVTPVGSGCVSGPTGPAVQSWDVEPGETYTVTLADVFECADGGTAATLDVRVNSTDLGNTDLVATLVSPGVYEFDFTMPVDGICTFPIFYCTTPGVGSSGTLVIRDDGVDFQAHLRAATFQPGCTDPLEILGGVCAPVPVDRPSWGMLKSVYN